jgi:hypothetical protein
MKLSSAFIVFINLEKSMSVDVRHALRGPEIRGIPVNRNERDTLTYQFLKYERQ